MVIQNVAGSPSIASGTASGCWLLEPCGGGSICSPEAIAIVPEAGFALESCVRDGVADCAAAELTVGRGPESVRGVEPAGWVNAENARYRPISSATATIASTSLVGSNRFVPIGS